MAMSINAAPSDLKITDVRFVDIDGAPKRCTLLKIMTNQGIEGYGEIRDTSSKPLAIDHFGHVCVEDCIRFAKRIEKYNIAWMEDMVPWIYTD